MCNDNEYLQDFIKENTKNLIMFYSFYNEDINKLATPDLEKIMEEYIYKITKSDVCREDV